MVLTFVLGPDKGPPVEVRADDTDLSAALVGCVRERAQRWIFPDALANRECVYRFETTVRG